MDTTYLDQKDSSVVLRRTHFTMKNCKIDPIDRSTSVTTSKPPLNLFIKTKDWAIAMNEGDEKISAFEQI